MGWCFLKNLRPGAVFISETGIYAMKTEYQTFDNGEQCDCYLLASGEAAHFPHQNDEIVREVPIVPYLYDGGSE